MPPMHVQCHDDNSETLARHISKLLANEWKIIPQMQEIVSEVAKRYALDLWQIDWVLYDVVKKRKPGDPPKYWLFLPGTGSENLSEWITKKIIAIGYMDLFLPRHWIGKQKLS